MCIADSVDGPYDDRRPGLDNIADIVAKVGVEEERRAAADEQSQAERRRQEFHRLADRAMH